MGKMKELYTLEQEVARDAEIHLLERIEESSKPKGGIWRIWAKALGEKASECDKEADKVAVVRTIVVGVNFITCLFIIAGIIRHW